MTEVVTNGGGGFPHGEGWALDASCMCSWPVGQIWNLIWSLAGNHLWFPQGVDSIGLKVARVGNRGILLQACSCPSRL